ncbi:MAG: hypothetical protein AB7G06_02050 [Bdellovibrionales bacterium]
MTEASPSILQAIAALLIVLGLIALAAWALKKFAFGGMTLQTAKGTKRLQVTESLWLDARYRLVIVKDGETEHKILLGPQGALQLAQDTTGLPHAK